MKTAVCMKYVPIVSRMKFDYEAKTILREGVPSEVNPFDLLGIKDVIDYKNEDISQRLGELCQDGIHVFFDNVGGDTLEIAIDHMADFGRIVLCGGISGYNDEEPAPGPRNLMNLVTRRIRMEGFIVIDYMDRFREAMDDLADWVMEGKIVWREDIQHGFENVPATLQRLFRGANIGKQLLQVADPQG